MAGLELRAIPTRAGMARNVARNSSPNHALSMRQRSGEIESVKERNYGIGVPVKQPMK